MLRSPCILVAALLLSVPALAEPLPRPAGLEPNVRFWARIYSEVDGNGGLIHDSEHMDVVYEKVRFPEGLSRRGRQRTVERTKDEIRQALRRLAAGKRSGLSDREARVLAQWPKGVSNATLRGAAGRVRFQLGQADKFRAGLIRAGAWRRYIESSLAERGVPTELVALPHVESSYNPRAYSRVGAAGMWQFTRSTGRRYLRVDHVVDERMDPYKSTVAAARLLSDNYARLGAWPLAITAYNHGSAGMARAVRQLGTRDIALISRRYKSRTFGFASRNFYAEFLAALEVDRNATSLFGAFQPDPPQRYDVVALDHYYPATSLARALGLDLDDLRRHNPALRASVWNGSKRVPRGFELHVPRGGAKAVQVALASIPAGERFAEQHRDRYYKVRRGDTLSTIARRYGVTISQLVRHNNLRSRHRIRAGQVLALPDTARGTRVQVARQEPPADGIYTVRRGDNLTVIGARFGISPSEMARANGLRNRNVLHVGQRLRLPGAPVAVTAAKTPAPSPEPEVQIASAEPAAPPDAPADARAVTPAEPLAEIAQAEPPAAEAPEEAQAAEAAGSPEPTASPGESPAAAPEEAPLMAETPDEPVQVAAVAPEANGGNGKRSNGHRPPDPSNYSVSATNRVVVQAEETLGHYAEWLELRASHLRRINGMRYGTPVVIGRSIRLDFSRVTPELFEQRRLAYHHDLQEDFFASYEVVGTTEHELRSGESLWYLAERKFRLPVWLLRQYNPDLDFGSLHPGTRMVIPEVEPRASS